MIIISLIALGIMNVVTWVGTTKVEKDLEEARLEIEKLKQILRNSEK